MEQHIFFTSSDSFLILRKKILTHLVQKMISLKNVLALML